MAQRATAFSKKAEPARPVFASVSAADVIRAPVVQRAMPLDLAALLKPYRRQGRLSLRVERVPQRAKLSLGRNNGDGSWSLASDELEGLTYLVPSDLATEHELTIRIMSFDDAAASTLKVIAYPIPNLNDDADAPVPQDVATIAPEPPQSPQPSQLEQMQSVFATRESDLMELRAALEEARAHKDADLASARAAWEVELRERLAETAVREIVQREQARVLWQAEQDKRAAEAEEEARRKITDEKLRARSDAENQIEAQRRLWQAQADERLAAERERWQAQAEAEAEIERKLWQAQADERVVAEREHWRAQTAALGSADRQRLEAEAETRVAAERARLEAQFQQQTQAELRRWQNETQATLSNAEERWKRDEAGRSAAALAEWQQQSARLLAEQAEKFQQREARAAQTRQDAPLPAGDNSAELDHLKSELSAADAALAARDAELANTRANLESERAHWHQEAEAALAAAESWKNDEPARLQAAVANTRAQFEGALAAATARCQNAEQALAANEANPTRNREDDAYIASLRKDITSLRAALVSREVELGHVQAALDQARQQQAYSAPSRPSPMRGTRAPEPEEAPSTGSRSLMRDFLLVVGLAVPAILCWPYVAAYLPENARTEIATLTGGVLTQGDDRAAVSRDVTPPPAPAPKRPTATLTHGANVHVTPTAKGDVVATLPKDASVTVVQQHGNWTLIEIAQKGAAVDLPLQGWVLSAYLSSTSPAAPAKPVQRTDVSAKQSITTTYRQPEQTVAQPDPTPAQPDPPLAAPAQPAQAVQQSDSSARPSIAPAVVQPDPPTSAN